MGLCFLLQGIFPTQGPNPHLLCLLHHRGFLTTNDTWEARYICMYVKWGIGSRHYGSWQVPRSVVSNLETQGELIFQFKFKGRKKNPMFQLDSSQKEKFLPTQHFFLFSYPAFLSHSEHHLIEACYIREGNLLFFISSTVNFIQKHPEWCLAKYLPLYPLPPPITQ